MEIPTFFEHKTTLPPMADFPQCVQGALKSLWDNLPFEGWPMLVANISKIRNTTDKLKVALVAEPSAALPSHTSSSHARDARVSKKHPNHYAIRVYEYHHFLAIPSTLSPSPLLPVRFAINNFRLAGWKTRTDRDKNCNTSSKTRGSGVKSWRSHCVSLTKLLQQHIVLKYACSVIWQSTLDE